MCVNEEGISYMKRFIAVLSGLLIMPAFAEVAPMYYYEDAIEYTDDFIDEDIVLDQVEEVIKPVAPVIPTTPSPRAATTNRSATRAIPASVSNASNTATRTSAQRAVSSRTTAGSAAARGNAAGTATTSRATAANTNSQGVSSRRNANTNTPSAVRSATTTNTGNLIQTDTVSSPLYTGRVGVRTTNTSSIGTRAPSATTRIATASVSAATTADVATTTTSMDEIAQMTDYCKAQYTQCMDNFCNVLDDNQGRCSCSANLKNYAKTEEALKKATDDLQDVAQRIQYIGLTSEEITTLFNQTEAEIQMQSQGTDSTQLANDLNRIKNLIVDVKTGTATASGDTSMSLDLSGLLDFSFSNSGFDLASLFGTTTTSTTSIANQRGAELYKTAAARCKASVLSTCQTQGVDIAVITNSYDLEIDKQCLMYERSLDDANTNMNSTVRNAKSVLQKARLMVAQQKNSYDLRGCVNALDSCMQDDFVCGSDYENCLDSTGRYIVNGEIVIGGTPGPSGVVNKTTGLYAAWGTLWDADTNLSKVITDSLTPGTAEPDEKAPSPMVGYLQKKIGYVDSADKSKGMCVSILNKCQNYTYTNGKDKKYEGNNAVVNNYMQRVVVQIKTAQDEVLANYAQNCINDVSSCLSTNGYVAGGSKNTRPNNVAISACKPVITTCASVVNTTNINMDDAQEAIVDAATVGGDAACPVNSFLNPTKTVAAAGNATTRAVIAATGGYGDQFCECNNVGVLVNDACPI